MDCPVSVEGFARTGKLALYAPAADSVLSSSNTDIKSRRPPSGRSIPEIFMWYWFPEQFIEYGLKRPAGVSVDSSHEIFLQFENLVTGLGRLFKGQIPGLFEHEGFQTCNFFGQRRRVAELQSRIATLFLPGNPTA